MEGFAFVAYHGSWNRDIPTGYKVVYLPVTNGEDVGDPVDLLRHAGSAARWPSQFRPVDVSFDACGRLLVSSDGSRDRSTTPTSYPGESIVRIERGPHTDLVPTLSPTNLPTLSPATAFPTVFPTIATLSPLPPPTNPPTSFVTNDPTMSPTNGNPIAVPDTPTPLPSSFPATNPPTVANTVGEVTSSAGGYPAFALWLLAAAHLLLRALF